jgi:hypothetical protein
MTPLVFSHAKFERYFANHAFIFDFGCTGTSEVRNQGQDFKHFMIS